MMMKKFYLILTCVTLCACGGGNKPYKVTEVLQPPFRPTFGFLF